MLASGIARRITLKSVKLRSPLTTCAEPMTLDDYIKVLAPVVPTSIVAAAAVWLSSKQGARNIKLTERQRRIDEAKLRSELFDRQYDAWLDLRMLATNRYIAILETKYGDSSLDIYKREDQAGFERASERLFFLFGNDVNKSVTELNNRLNMFLAATVKERSSTLPYGAVQLEAQAETISAMRDVECALANLKILVKLYMEPAASLTVESAPKRWRLFPRRAVPSGRVLDGSAG